MLIHSADVRLPLLVSRSQQVSRSVGAAGLTEIYDVGGIFDIVLVALVDDGVSIDSDGQSRCSISVQESIISYSTEDLLGFSSARQWISVTNLTHDNVTRHM